MKIQVYGQSSCGPCRMAKKYLTENLPDSVEFEYLDIQKDNKAYAKYKSFGVRGVPYFALSKEGSNTVYAKGFGGTVIREIKDYFDVELP